MPRHQVKQVICSLCGTEQGVQQNCTNCGVCMGKYFCGTCKLFDDDISKQQYHCNGCGICRTGGHENFFHCNKCRCCYSTLLKNSHPCVEGAMHHDCPVCFEYLFDSRNDVIVMPCGHTIHKSCLNEMREHYQYACPLCSKSVCDMSKVWEKLDMEIAATPMPESYQNKMVWILCNDCGKTCHVKFHFVAQKCLNCKSYNTRQTRAWANGIQLRIGLFIMKWKFPFHFNWFISKEVALNAVTSRVHRIFQHWNNDSPFWFRVGE